MRRTVIKRFVTVIVVALVGGSIEGCQSARQSPSARPAEPLASKSPNAKNASKEGATDRNAKFTVDEREAFAIVSVVGDPVRVIDGRFANGDKAHGDVDITVRNETNKTVSSFELSINYSPDCIDLMYVLAPINPAYGNTAMRNDPPISPGQTVALSLSRKRYDDLIRVQRRYRSCRDKKPEIRLAQVVFSDGTRWRDY